MTQDLDGAGQAGTHSEAGNVEVYKGRGVFVARGFTAAEIMEGAAALERRFEVSHFTARRMAEAVLEAARDASETSPAR